MNADAGARIGPYEITARIGEGGMGEVYRATDTNLKRQVAIKVLPESLADDPDRLARFQREAEVLAALNHPNVAQIYGIERSAGTLALVMELVEGPTLDERIGSRLTAQGSGLPVDEALAIARQIAEALEAAHEQGIIHRDLKPANIKVRDDGTVKVLDFGLAKALEPSSGIGLPAAGALTNSPTLTSPALMTGAGIILGTAAYMSPEQAKGRVVDKRSDVWAFGCVLFEMLAGKRAFEGEDVTDTIAAVVRGEPDWAALPPDVPEQIRLLLKRCLEKDRKARVSDMGVARFLLTEMMPAPASQPAAIAAPLAVARPPLWKRALPAAAAAVVAGATVGVAVWALRPTPPSSPVTRFTLTLGEGQQFTPNNTKSLAISPDGALIVYAGGGQLYLRSMADADARPIPGTQETPAPNTPVFSPDGRSVAFYSSLDRAIKKIAVSGGAAITICPAGSPFLGMAWDAGGIVFAQGSKGIMRVSENSGQPTVIATVKSGEVAASPDLLPGGDWVLFTIATAQTAEGWDKAQIVAQSLKTSERKMLIAGGSDARFLPTGHVMYALGGLVLAVPFDLRHVAVTGGPVPVIEGVKRSPSGAFSTTHLSVSSTGSLVFVPGPASTLGQFDLALIDRSGVAQPLKLPPRRYEYPRLSPDGKRIAFGSDDGKEAVVWIYDVSGASSARRLTLGGRNRVPVWANDGEHVAFQSDREGDLAIFWQRADGTTAAERLTKPEKDTAHAPESWSPDGRTLLFSVGRGSTYSLAALSLPDKKVTPFNDIQSPYPPSAVFSPDGKWMAYSAGGSDGPAGSLFVQPFPPAVAKYPISQGPAIHAVWALDGKELVYGATQAQLATVSVAARPAFTFSNPVTFARPFIEPGPTFERNNDITSDGKQFLGVVAAGQARTASGAAAAAEIHVVLNWFEELRQKVPTK